MIIRIKSIEVLENYLLHIIFDDGKNVIYDMNEDIENLPGYIDLKNHGLFKQVKIDHSRTCIYWNDSIDLPSDIIYKYGIDIK